MPSCHFRRETLRRVEGLSFHKKRPWILASLCNGVIELWDYSIPWLIHSFNDDDVHQGGGSVRAVNFHDYQPYFASGGDDRKIKIWSYECRRCLFTLVGHLDHIRTVQFHREFPWIVSASDDRTIRIWNWESCTCIAVLSGHKDSVTSASFHPNKDFVLSSSMDQTVKIWDISSLTPRNIYDQVFVKYIFKGHQGGVNWASFHPTLPLIVSGANDYQIKIWQIEGFKTYDLNKTCLRVTYSVSDAKAWHVATLSGHTSGVSCVSFHSSKKDYIISSSEDETFRVWDAKKNICIHEIYLDDGDRFWVLSSQLDMNLVAAGHENGFIVMKLERERPAFSASGNSLLYLKDQFLHVYDYSTQKDIQLIPIHTPCSNGLNEDSRSLSYSPTEDAALICSDMVEDSYELHFVPKDSCDRGNVVQEASRGNGGSAVFVGSIMFAVLEKSSNQLFVKNLKNEIITNGVLPIDADAIFYAGTGTLLCRAEDRVFIFDLQQWTVLGNLQVSYIKYIVWSNDFKNVALLRKHSIFIADKKLVCHASVRERSTVKGGAWGDDGVFIYSTLTHIKYCLPNGDTGIIKTLDVPVYITKIYGNTIFCFNREGNICQILIDSTEYVLKLSLLRKRYDQVSGMIRNSEFCCRSMIAYLLQKGFPEFALHFVKDKRTRLKLALESRNIEIAVDSAEEIGGMDDWYKLGEEALHRGKIRIVEYAYQCRKNIGKLSFLYLITGNLDKLSKMMKVAEDKNDVVAQFHNALCLGDIQERVKILENQGHLPLAYITASVHGLHDIAERLAAELGGNVPSLSKWKSASLLIPPKPILRAEDWPLLMVTRESLEAGLDNADWGNQVEYDAQGLRFRESRKSSFMN